MEFIKKNWEKVLLGVVLVGLLGAVAYLPLKISAEQRELKEKSEILVSRKVNPIEAPDLSAAKTVLERTAHHVNLDLNTSNRLFNPVAWKRTSSGQIIKVETGGEIGVEAVEVQRISPLYLIITFDSVLASDTSIRYVIGVERQGEERVSARRKRATYVSVGDKNDAFTLRGIKGPPEDPTAVELELSDTGQRVTVTKDAPYKRVDGYMADLAYPPESRTWDDKRVGDTIVLEREIYKIVAITEKEVVLSAPSGKKTTLKPKSGK